MPDPDSPLYALANLLVDLLKDISHEDASTPIQDLNSKSQDLGVDVEVLTK